MAPAHCAIGSARVGDRSGARARMSCGFGGTHAGSRAIGRCRNSVWNRCRHRRIRCSFSGFGALARPCCMSCWRTAPSGLPRIPGGAFIHRPASSPTRPSSRSASSVRWIAGGSQPHGPQEDEFALLLLGEPSVYRGFIDPRRLRECAELPTPPVFSMNFEQTPRHGTLTTAPWRSSRDPGSSSTTSAIRTTRICRRCRTRSTIWSATPPRPVICWRLSPALAAQLRGLIDAQLAQHGQAQ